MGGGEAGKPSSKLKSSKLKTGPNNTMMLEMGAWNFGGNPKIQSRSTARWQFLRRHRPFLMGLLLFLSPFSPFLSQGAPVTNRVLELDGANSFVELPPNIFDSLRQATVEGWVQWGRARSDARLFDFGDRDAEIYVRSDGTQLIALVAGRDATRHRIEVAGILRTNDWCHIAFITGPGGAKLYFNGTLVGTNAYEGSFAMLAGRNNYLGKSNYRSSDSTMRGGLDEVRVWDHARTVEQIRENMFKTLSGAEAGLMGYWNFNDGTAKDRTAKGHDGTLVGGAGFAEATLPDARGLRRADVAWISGKITEPNGAAVTNIDVTVREGTRRLGGTRTDNAGEFRVSVVSGTNALQIAALRSDRGGGHTDLRLSPGEGRRLDFALQQTRLAGRVLGADGQPRQGLRVDLVSADSEQSLTNSVTGSRGEFHFNAPLPGKYLLRASVNAQVLSLNEDAPVDVSWGAMQTNLEFRLAASASPTPASVPLRRRETQRNGLVLDLTGETGFVELGDGGPVLGSTFTQELWIWPPHQQRWGGLIGGYDESRALRAETSRAPCIYYQPGGRLHGGFGDGTNWLSWNTPNNVLTLGEWNHVATTYDGTNYRVYVNGNVVGTFARAGVPLAAPVRWIGKMNSHFDGKIDDVRIWNTVRSAQEIRTDMTNAITGTSARTRFTAGWLTKPGLDLIGRRKPSFRVAASCCIASALTALLNCPETSLPISMKPRSRPGCDGSRAGAGHTRWISAGWGITPISAITAVQRCFTELMTRLG
jgi:Concanavalin A-like lectin/glucanases superfamily/Carboxypeptidase regulatory-like domain